ncbi:MAG: acyl carrier protein [Phycisphaerae bacterium]|nr:acyl carrier protein [Phycisphaerae bacterium]
MTEQEIFERLAPLITEVTGIPPETVTMDSVLVTDLGAESIDLLDLSFLIEEAFGITIEANEFEAQVRERIPGGVYERNGCLTEEALAELRKAMPEVQPRHFAPGLCAADIPSLLTVAVFVHLVQRKLDQRVEGPVHA